MLPCVCLVIDHKKISKCGEEKQEAQEVPPCNKFLSKLILIIFNKLNFFFLAHIITSGWSRLWKALQWHLPWRAAIFRTRNTQLSHVYVLHKRPHQSLCGLPFLWTIVDVSLGFQKGFPSNVSYHERKFTIYYGQPNKKACLLSPAQPKNGFLTSQI